MLKKILTTTALLFSLSSFAAVDVNKANAAELDAIKGIGPSLSGLETFQKISPHAGQMHTLIDLRRY